MKIIPLVIMVMDSRSTWRTICAQLQMKTEQTYFFHYEIFSIQYLGTSKAVGLYV